MKFFMDTAIIAEIKDAAEMGLVDGVTTNPSLLVKSGMKAEDVYREICRLVPGPVSAEVYATDLDGMLSEARVLAKIAGNIVVKIPMTRDGIKAVRILKSEGIKTNVTLVFSPSQALLAAKAGASFVSPFIGRLDDISHEGMELVEQIIAIYENYDFDTEIIVASIRHPQHVVDAAMLGADIATMPKAVFEKLFMHPLTDAGIAKFVEDSGKIPR
ncbi:fructose-6-phosphate aldolase [bacterium]|nr:fructose-6-phosphate aldolase [candidate division CSSED10-310 bacterium]